MYKIYINKDVEWNIEELQWDFSPIVPKEYLKWCIARFEDKEFYDLLEPMDGAFQVLEELSKQHEIVIVTKKSPKAAIYNDAWIKKFYPFINRVIYLDQWDFDKSIIQGEVIIDDKWECLKGGNRSLRILFGDYGWNKDKPNDYGHMTIRKSSWSDIGKFLENIFSETSSF